MRRIKSIWHSLFTGLGMGFMIMVLLLLQSFYDRNREEKEKESVGNEYRVYALDIPDTLHFAGEDVPLEYFDTRESFDRELLVNTYWQSSTLLLIKRSNRYFPLISSILAEYDIPDDFKYLPVAESDLMNAVSPAGAVGFWQLMPGTARDYGLEVSSEVDERYHVVKSTHAACKYLLESYEKYGNWTMVAASYNSGRRGVDRQIDRQKETDYYDLLLNEETSRYIFRILAFKTIFSDPRKYGFYFEEDDLYQPIPTYTVEVDTAVISFADFADEHGTNYKILKYLNPWLREAWLKNPKEKTYAIRIPMEGARKQIPLTTLPANDQLSDER